MVHTEYTQPQGSYDIMHSIRHCGTQSSKQDYVMCNASRIEAIACGFKQKQTIDCITIYFYEWTTDAVEYNWLDFTAQANKLLF